jgi:hypothetical protein
VPPASSHTVAPPHEAAWATSPGALLLGRGAGDDQCTALGEPAVDALGGVDAADLVDRLAQRGEHGPRRPVVAGSRRASMSGETGHNADTQPPLRPLAPKPTWSASSTSTSSEGSATQQVVRRPQPGEATADDDHLDGENGRSDAVARVALAPSAHRGLVRLTASVRGGSRPR